MQAVTIVDGDLQWQEHPDPEPGPHELLVAVRAAGLNGADMMQRRGFYPAPPGYPQDIPGMEFAGEVVGLGSEVRRHSLGDRVMALTGGGAQAELVVVDEGSVIDVPENITWEEAGGFPEVFTTAHDALFTQVGLTAGERVLVTGAAGGVGTAGVQLAHATGAHVVASARRAEQHKQLKELGADEVILPDQTGEHGPYDVALELVGGPSVPDVLAALETGGRIAVIGIGAGRTTELDLSALMYKRARISGSTLRGRSLEDKAAIARTMETHVLPLLAEERIRVPVAEIYPMRDAAAGYDAFAQGGKLGKIVLVTSL
ncbi:MAG TPA: zinc-binding dehydrogenase [Acidimicrobiales bacterium]|nr:zinc-binding dehydrogenase [Acidimicrobiales bacterium]